MNKALKPTLILGAIAMVASSFAVTYIETFPDPLGSYYSGWLGLNSNLGSYYYANGDPDINQRGNNPAGIWAADTQTLGAGTGGNTMDIVFNPVFGSTLTSLAFGMEAFIPVNVTIFDMTNTAVASGNFSGGDFGFDHADILSASGINGVSHILFDSSPFGGGDIEGNTSLDNFRAESAVPEPATLSAIGLGLVALARKRKK